MKNKKTTTSYLINFAAIAVLYAALKLLIVFGVIDRYYSGVLLIICTNIVLAVSLNVVTGFLGQIALGHAGFMSIGAYSAALFSLGLPNLPAVPRFLAALLVGGVMAAVFGLLVGIPALRLKGDYLAIITLGFGEIIRVIIENMSVTGGAQGLRGIPNLASFDLVFWVTVITVAVIFTFIHSRHGRAITAIREDDIASSAAGINNTYYKVMAFVVGAFFAGIAGGIYAHNLTVLSAKTFSFNYSIEILVIVVLGGMGSLTGSVFAAIGLTVLTEFLREFSDYRLLIYAIVLIVLMIFKPSGLFGRYEFSLTRALHRLTGHEPRPGRQRKSPKKEAES
ncbi:branched-chain amino acid ABC transporter permease [Feifania hominis]|uniref:Branched-chain amino acid ABC transporter permease n=1 Tax=Feifania hominis TaxID=2763660 RepID=A0A926DE67_9FIRM|nr:branched-chain amino acid ABC transporter permease [Feifania hominis]MBC8536197.1 branched-chain amino acid ABC transporter permease [Feifania hominis]